MKYTFIPLYVFVLLYFSCSNISSAAKFWNGGDITSPSILKISAISNHKYTIEFDETISDTNPTITIDTENINIHNIIITDVNLTFSLSEDTLVGQSYNISSLVQDIAGNQLLFVETIYGFNPRVPKLLISEFLTEGSKTRPDKTEIIVISDGNLAGVTLQEGAYNLFKQRVIFPSIEVSAGDFVIVHWRPNILEKFTNELHNKQESSHPQSYKNAWDIFSNNDKGISNTNGSLSLLSSPKDGVFIDAVVFSVKTDDQSHKYKGFGSSHTFLWAQEIISHTMWKSKTGLSQILLPSDTISPKDSSTTRSISRNSEYTDTNSASDWHITPGSKSTFAKQNTNSVYTPKVKK